MSISKFFPKRERTEKELKEREYNKKFKKIFNSVIKNPTAFRERMDEAEELMKDAVKDGVMSEKDRQKQLKNFTKKAEKLNNFLSKTRR